MAPPDRRAVGAVPVDGGGLLPDHGFLVIALESLLGEKERGTIEPLLSSPLKDWQLFMGKLLAGTIAASFYRLRGYHGLYDRPLFSAYPIPGCHRMAET